MPGVVAGTTTPGVFRSGAGSGAGVVPEPPVGSFLLLEDDTSFLLLEDDVSMLELETGNL